MSYVLKKTNGTTLVTIQDGSIDSATDLVFVGKNYAGYGQTINENFLKLLENFANTKQPADPLNGQVWYDSANLKLRFYDSVNARFKSLTVTDVASNKPSDLKAGDQWFDTVDQKLYVYNGMDFVMIGPEKSITALQSAIGPSIVADNLNNNYTVLGASVGTGGGSTVAVFSPNAFTPNANSLLASDQKFANVARGITLPGTRVANGSKDPTVIGALPDRANKWIFFGAAGSSWGLLENDALGNIIFYDSKNYIRRDEFASFSGSLTVNSDFGILAGTNRVIQMHVTNNTIGNLSNINYTTLKFNVNPGTGLTNVITLDGTSGLKVLPSSVSNVDLGTSGDGGSFVNGYIKNLYASSLTTSTSGVIRGNWVLAAGSQISGGTITGSSSALATSSTYLESYVRDAQTFVHTDITDVPFSITQRNSAGAIQVTGISVASTGTSKITGAWILDTASTLQATTILGAGTTGYVTPSQGVANNSIAQRDGTGGLSATAITTPWIYAGSGNSANGKISGTWTLDGTSTLEATYSDLAEKYHADGPYEEGTVLVVGGSYEVTTTTKRADPSIAGIVSTKPAFKMNQAAGPESTHPYIALKGRVPCKVNGTIRKGDRLVSSSLSGHAEAWKPGDDPNAVLGIALEDHIVIDGTGIIEVKV
jgi:hypothetical protein